MKEIRVFEAFAGYGSQLMALKRIEEMHPNEFKVIPVGYAEIDKYAIEAYNHLKECGAGSIVDESFIQETTEADLFAPYYMMTEKAYKSFTGKTPAADNKSIAWDKDRERYLSWNYNEYEDWISWQMYCANVPWDAEMPILPGLRITKCIVNTL